MKNVNMSNSQQFTATLVPLDSNGNPGLAGAGVPSWSFSPVGLTITPAADGKSALIASGNAPGGVYTVNVSGQSSNGANIGGSFTATVAENPASSFDFSFSPVVNT
ncbi:MAG: hypothetical protein WAN65_19175 [Candidatus Sulfotelmatobacter sp.]